MKRGRNLPAEDQGEWLTEQLRDPELCVAYLNAALAEGDQAAFMLALRNVAKARSKDSSRAMGKPGRSPSSRIRKNSRPT